MDMIEKPFGISVLIMGVSGSGKSTVGRRLARQLNATFHDGDDFHSPENIEKMANGTPLSDEDRIPWLLTINEHLCSCFHRGERTVYACSGLKRNHREILRKDAGFLHIFWLQGHYDTILRRLEKRSSHFFPKELLLSQFQTLEVPAESECVSPISVSFPVDVVVEKIVSRLKT